MSGIGDLEAGVAAEHLVCAELLMTGYRAYRTDQHCPYDVAVEAGGRLLRVQVKATRKPRKIPQRVNHHPGYLFHTRRAGKGGLRTYQDGEFDLLALVALDIGRIAYIPFVGLKSVIIIRVPGVEYLGRNRIGRTFDGLDLETALSEVA